MDYNQKGQLDNKEQAFFTAGVGNIPSEQNTFESENNLDLSNESTSWSSGRKQSIGNRAMELRNINSTNISREELEERFRDVIDLAPPPVPEAIPDMPLQSNNKVFNPAAIRTEGDRISKSTMREVNNAVLKFNQTGDVSDFYALIRGDESNPGMMQANLKNSFNREVK